MDNLAHLRHDLDTAPRWNGNGKGGSGRREALPLAVIDPAGWQGQPVPPRRWLVEGLIPHGAVTLLGGDGGLGKSLLMLQLQTAAATATPWLGVPTEACSSFGLYCEDDEGELHRRMAAICDGFGLALTDLGGRMHFATRVGLATEFLDRDKFGKAKGPSAVFFQVLETVQRLGVRLVILDGLHDLFDGNENSRPEARQFVNLLRRIALAIDGAVVLCAHPSLAGLNSGSGTSGSTAWNNAVRSRLYLARPVTEGDTPPDPDLREMRTMKANYGKVGERIRLRWQQGVFVRDGGAEIATGPMVRMTRQQVFLACLDVASEQGRYPADAVNSPRYAPRLFASMPQAKDLGRKELELAMRDLFDLGRIKVGSVLGPDRHPVKAIVRTTP